MLTEHRQLIFPMNDLWSALARHGILSGTPDDFQLNDFNADKFEFSVAYEAGETAEKLVLDTEQVLQAMLRYCIDNGIPIPKHGSKSIDRIDGEMCLKIDIDAKSSAEQKNNYYVLL